MIIIVVTCNWSITIQSTRRQILSSSSLAPIETIFDNPSQLSPAAESSFSYLMDCRTRIGQGYCSCLDSWNPGEILPLTNACQRLNHSMSSSRTSSLARSTRVSRNFLAGTLLLNRRSTSANVRFFVSGTRKYAQRRLSPMIPPKKNPHLAPQFHAACCIIRGASCPYTRTPAL